MNEEDKKLFLNMEEGKLPSYNTVEFYIPGLIHNTKKLNEAKRVAEDDEFIKTLSDDELVEYAVNFERNTNELTIDSKYSVLVDNVLIDGKTVFSYINALVSKYITTIGVSYEHVYFFKSVLDTFDKKQDVFTIQQYDMYKFVSSKTPCNSKNEIKQRVIVDCYFAEFEIERFVRNAIVEKHKVDSGKRESEKMQQIMQSNEVVESESEPETKQQTTKKTTKKQKTKVQHDGIFEDTIGEVDNGIVNTVYTGIENNKDTE